MRGVKEMRRARFVSIRQQSAINRIAEMYSNLKVKKVHAQMLL